MLCRSVELITSKKIYYLLLKNSYLDFYKKNSSEIIKDFRDSIGAYVLYIENVTRIISDLLIFIFFTILLLNISFYETLIIFSYFIFAILIFRKLLSGSSKRLGKTTNLSANHINLAIINSYKNFAQIILRKLKEKYLNFILKHVDQYSFSRLLSSFIISNTKQVIEIFVIIFILIILFLVEKIYSPSTVLTLASIYIVSAYRLLPLASNLVSSYTRLKNLEFGYKIINTKILLYSKKNKNYSNKNNTKKIIFERNLKLKNIYFKYPQRNSFVIKNLNFEIKKNDMIGIIGQSGQGKSTLIKIILGLIEHDKGTILIDDKEISKNNISNYQSLFSYLPQENHLVPGTIKENIAFGEDLINENKVLQVLKKTNSYNFVNKLNKKINYVISENGKNFSAGQLQRLALARMLYFDTDIIILDEPTSSLDEKAEKKFNNLISILKKTKTIIIISHKRNSLIKCDRVFEFKNKKLIKKR
jgi:ABC-type bacteriocin/lantibiotic exporter with double-glycine peptidase domain